LSGRQVSSPLVFVAFNSGSPCELRKKANRCVRSGFPQAFQLRASSQFYMYRRENGKRAIAHSSIWRMGPTYIVSPISLVRVKPSIMLRRLTYSMETLTPWFKYRFSER
jgi:hypothetical protein